MPYFQRSSFFAFILLPILLFQLMQPLSVSAQENPCDPDLDQSTTDQLGYHLRGDRCEGRYIQDVGSTILFLVSFTESFEEYDLDSGQDLIVEWSVPSKLLVHLRAQGLRQRLYYRMDVLCSSENPSYHWPTDILAALAISHGTLGVIGWFTDSAKDFERDVYVPLRIGQQGETKQSGTYKVVLWPGKELAEVYISLATVNIDGSPEHFIKEGEPLEYGYYPAFQGIEFELPDLETAGVYYLEIGATLREGGSVTTEHWFYHAD